MPVERLSHPTDGTSRKLGDLSDFEFRVWCQYKLSANDVGVMVDSPNPLMADNRVLERRGAAQVRKALSRLIAVELLLRFEDQGAGYVCSPVWQDYQTIRRPRATHLPTPQGAVLARCSEETRGLFVRLLAEAAQRRSSRRTTSETGDDGGNISVILPESSGNLSERFPLACTHARATAIATAVAEGEPERDDPPPASDPPGTTRRRPGLAPIAPGPGLGRRATLLPPAPKNAVFAGKFVVPDFLHAEFQRLSGKSHDALLAWYQALDREWRDRVIGEGDLKFLRARFEAWVGRTAAPDARAVARAIGPTARAPWRDQCPHGGACGTPTQCALASAKAKGTTLAEELEALTGEPDAPLSAGGAA